MYAKALKSYKDLKARNSKLFIKVYIDDNDFCYQKHNPQVYREGVWGCNEECNVGECEEYELFMDNPTADFSTKRDKIITVCWLRTPNLDLGVIYPQYENCETRVLNKAM
jgi:hypothetical protein